MPAKRALIVDDSKTAQFKLKKLLEQYPLSVDTVFSGEDALSYLSYQIPDIIFMDHSMKGMDGLDAVKIIKSNPATATIPVVMYTAKSGDIYLGQARAIGAIDVLSKDVMTESDIQRVMKSLHLTAEDLTEASTALPTTGGRAAVPYSARPPLPESLAGLERIRDQVASSMDIQQGQMRRDIQDNTRLLVNRFMREIGGLRADLDRQQKRHSEMISAQLAQPETPTNKVHKGLLVSAFALLLAITAFSTYRALESKQRNQQLTSEMRGLATTVEEQQLTIERTSAQLERRSNQNSALKSDQLLSALVWAINQKGQFDYAEKALSEERVGMIGGLVNHLNQAKFTGTLTLNIHNGNYCVVIDDYGQLVLPQDPVPVTGCALISESARNLDSTSQTSLAFINAVQTSPIVERGDLKIEIRAHGVRSPQFDYPLVSSEITSEQWNAVASTNNRLNINLRYE